MARYTCLFTISVPVENVQGLLIEVLETCNLEIIYASGDYIMGREMPGQIPFSKLVTVEVLMDRTTATDREIRMSCVVKNEELPLQVDNHCRQMFDLVNRTITENRHWKLIEQVAG
jgi:hypothetical protein